MKKTGLILLVLALLAAPFAGCSSDSGSPEAPADGAGAEAAAPADTATDSGAADDGDGDKVLTIAFSQTGNQNNWKVVQTNDMREWVEGAGHNYIYTDGQDDTAKQISDIEDIIAQQPDYLVISPREYEGYTAVLEAAKAANIPTILVDRAARGEGGVDYTVLNCGDFIWEGNTIAEYMHEQFGDGRCNIVELAGTPGGSVTIDRGEGFAQGIEPYDNMNIIASQVGNFSRAESQQAMENLIQAYGDEIDAVYAHNDDNAIGAIQAIKAAGLTPGEDILVYGIDGQHDALQAIINGDLEATVLCSPRFGESVLNIIAMLENGEDVPGFIANPGKLYTIDNAEECLDEAY